MLRIHNVTSTQGQLELARFLGVRQAQVSDANRRGSVPVEWLAVLRNRLNIRPEWILGGEGSVFQETPGTKAGN